MKPNRREVLGAGFAGALGLLGVAVPRVAAHQGELSTEEFRTLAIHANCPADYGRLVDHFRALQKSAEAEAVLYQGIAKQYRNGLPGATEGQVWEVTSALKHVAEHSLDTAEALQDLIATYQGLAENYSG